MGTDGNERVHAVVIANHPHTLGILQAGADLTDLIIPRFPGLEDRRGFVEDAGEEKREST